VPRAKTGTTALLGARAVPRSKGYSDPYDGCKLVATRMMTGDDWSMNVPCGACGLPFSPLL